MHPRESMKTYGVGTIIAGIIIVAVTMMIKWLTR
jgi:hypothetical protein